MANDPFVNKLCITSIMLTSIVKRDSKKVTTYDFPVSLRRSLHQFVYIIAYLQ